MSSPQEPTTALSRLQDCRRAVQHRLARVRRRLRAQLVIEGVAWALATAVLLAAISLIGDRIIRPDLTVRTALLFVGLAMLIAICIRRLYQPVSLKLDDLDLAELLERRQKGVGQRLSNILLLPQLQVQDPSASPAMIHAAVQEDFAALQQIDLHASLNSQRRRNVWLLIAGLLTPVAVFCLANPAIASLWARRWFAGADLRWPQQTYLSVTGLKDTSQLQVPRGETALLQVDAQPEFQQQHGLWILSGRGQPLVIEGRERPMSQIPSSVSLKLRLSDGTERLGTFTQFSAGQFRYELPPLSHPAEVTVTGGDDWFGPLRIEPIDRPAVANLIIAANTPGKSEPDIYQAADAEKQLLFLPGTRLEIKLNSNQPLTLASATVSGTEQKHELPRLTDSQFQLNWEMKESVSLEFHLHGESGLESKPYFLTFGILNDRPPRLTLRSTGVGRRVTPVVRIPLHLRAMDDFGVAELSLELEETHLVESKPVTSNKQPLKETFLANETTKLPLDINREPIVELTEYALNPGTTVRIRGKATDACALGFQSSESRWLAFQVVTPEELFYEILTRQREQRARFGKAVDTAKSQLDLLNKMTTAADASLIVRTHQAMTRQVWQIAGQLDATLQEMTLNDLGTPTARDLLQTSVIQPLRELHDRPLAELLKSLSTLVIGNAINEDHREQAIEAQTQTVQLMQRILDQMSQWESFIDVVNQLRHVIASQEKIRDTTEQMQKKQISDVFEE